MEKFDSFYNKILLGHVDKIALGTIIIIFIAFSYSVYFLFNRPVDPQIKAKVMQETQSVEIKFNEDTIKAITESKDYGSTLDPSTEGKNPFITY